MMSKYQPALLDWITEGRLQAKNVASALVLAGFRPNSKQWYQFFLYLTLWLGVVCCASAVIFFFAYNWQAMGRFAKFALVELLIIASLVICWRVDLDRAVSKASSLFSSLLVGALLALVGQTYQTGADTYELFAIWAMAIFPWVLVSRLGALWLFWIALINIAMLLYYDTFGGLFGWLFDAEQMCWASFIFNTIALICWEFAAKQEVNWLIERWSVRLLAIASGSLITLLTAWYILDDNSNQAFTWLIYFLWMLAVYWFYRHIVLDVFVLAGAVLSAIGMITITVSKYWLEFNDAGSFLFISILIIILSALGGFWLKAVANEEEK